MRSTKADLLNAAVGAGTIFLATFLATWLQRHLGFATPLAASSGVGLAGVVGVLCAGPGIFKRRSSALLFIGLVTLATFFLAWLWIAVTTR